MSIDPADVVTALAQHLHNLDVAEYSETAYPEDTDGVPFIYFGLLPDSPDLAITINPYLTDPDIDTQATNPLHRVQLRYRAPGTDPRAVERLAHTVFQAIHTQTPGLWPGRVRPQTCLRTISAPPESDSNVRWEKADSYEIRLNPSQE